MSIPYERSFASHEKSQYWSSKNGNITQRQVFKSTNKKYWFDCVVCKHMFNIHLNNVTKGNWCSYCSNKKLCDDVDCNVCLEKSFASHEKSQFWSSKNGNISPSQVYKSSHNKYWFDCIVCKHSFNTHLNNVTNLDRWCPYCVNQKLCDDVDCNICFEKSFASHEKSQYWSSKNGNISPRQLFKSSGNKYWFDCIVCKHSFDTQLYSVTAGNWCSYCSNKKLCDDVDCNVCLEKSFASHEKNQYWSSKNGDILPRQVFKSTNNKYWFECIVCKHPFNILLSNVTAGKWCSYCVNQKLCDDVDCNTCFEKSFASHEKSQYWSSKNGDILPRQVFKSTNNKYWFECIVCKHSFDTILNNVMSGRWCSYCVNKTESKLFQSLLPLYSNIVKQFKQEWCKNIRYLPYDFCIPEHNIIIELDGRQHFQQVSNWQSPEQTYENDKFKEKCANDNNYSVIRLLQEDVWNDKNDWYKHLCDAIEYIKNGDEIVNICIGGKNGEYTNY
jgi:very-short-patch-repair endonuclease